MRDHDHDRGLAFDLATLVSRRQLFSLAAGVGTAALAACGSDDGDGDETADTEAAQASSGDSAATSATKASAATDASGSTSATGAPGDTADTSCTPIPEETAGPFPGDGSNGPDVLSESGVVRADIRSSVGSASGVADGIPLTVELTLTDTSADCSPLAGGAVYMWHCDREGRYSMYSEGVENENYLRGVQEADADGRLAFTTIFPACYSGRWPHIHCEIYTDLDAATNGGEPIATSQLALPADVCTTVYATEGYEQSVSNLDATSLEGDNVFSDGSDEQLAAVTGDTSAGYVATLTVGV